MEQDQLITALNNDLAQARGQVDIFAAKHSAANQALGEIMTGNVNLRADVLLLQYKLQQVSDGNSGLLANIRALEEQLKNAAPDAATQIIELNNQIAKLTEDNTRMGRVIEAMSRKIISLGGAVEEEKPVETDVQQEADAAA
jgi:hypothetical protein